MNLWVDGTYQNTDRSEAEATLVANSIPAGRDEWDVDSAGVGFGTKLTYEL